MRESQLQSKVLEELRKYGWFYKASDRYQAGIPDIIGCIEGRFYAFELKIVGNSPTPFQLYQMKGIYREGGHVFVLSYSNDTKKYNANDTKYDNLRELIECTIRLNHSSIRGSASKQ